jgi:hypothetical protein
MIALGTVVSSRGCMRSMLETNTILACFSVCTGDIGQCFLRVGTRFDEPKLLSI